MDKIIKAIPINLIKLYQYLLSPLFGNCCRFYPSCSTYAIEAIKLHGFYGALLAIKRLLRCHPFNPGGADPVPHQTTEKTCLPH